LLIATASATGATSRTMTETISSGLSRLNGCLLHYTLFRAPRKTIVNLA
jgi:hypothetical protein